MRVGAVVGRASATTGGGGLRTFLHYALFVLGLLLIVAEPDTWQQNVVNAGLAGVAFVLAWLLSPVREQRGWER